MAAQDSRRVALVANTSFYVGPDIARMLAARDHDLVIGDPADGLVDELEATGAQVETVTGVMDLADPTNARTLVDAGLERFGRIDAATAFTGRVITGPFADASIDDVRALEQGCFEAPFHFLQAVLPSMVEQGSGQVLVLTSSSGQRVTPNAPIYSAMRAGATHLLKNVAAEVAPSGVSVNGLGTNFMDFPEFLRASGATDPKVREFIESRVPLRRLGTVEECAALCVAYLDGSCTFVTGQFVAHDGGWS